MPTQQPPQQKLEQSLAREFLVFLGFGKITMRTSERPDVRAQATSKGHRHQLGIELTQYQVDAPPGQSSPMCRFRKFWLQLRGSITRLIAEGPCFPQVRVWVKFKTMDVPLGRITHDLAAELVSLAFENPVPRELRHFPNAYPLLQQHMGEVHIYQSVAATGQSWYCHNIAGAWLGIEPEHIRSIIRQKAEKAQGYSRENSDEMWLLIYAHGSPIVCSAGPCPESIAWQEIGLIEEIGSTPFDRIFFWDRVFDWCKPLSPVGDIIRAHTN